ncbi:MAG: H-NS family nucleoid-associated regulatory protein [Betaproteobacteria bacterium]
MAQTYARLQKQIASLEAEAQKLKKSEVSGVIAKIKEAIAVYGLTTADLFAGRAAKRGKTKAGNRTGFKYADAQGNTWVGMGKRPQWLRDALADGKSLEDFRVNGAAKPKSASAVASLKKAGAGKKRKGVGKARFRDGAGHSWSGFGPRPGWLKSAIASGKALDELRV